MNRTPYGSIASLLSEGILEDVDSLDYETYIRFFDAFAERAGMEIDVLPGGLRLYAAGDGRPSTFIIAGQHGDERAGPIALLEMVRDEELPALGSVRICPITHPEAWDSHTRMPGGLDMNRVWDMNEAPPEILTLMMSIESRPPDFFLDLHESNHEHSKSGEMFEIRHSDTPWGRRLVHALGPGVVAHKLHSYIDGSARKYTYDFGVRETAVTETSTLFSLPERVEFHKEVIRLCVSV